MSPAPSMFDLTGRVAVVTGGNGGIGRAIAMGLGSAGAAVAVLARNEQKNAATLTQLRASGISSLALHLDVTNRAALAPAVPPTHLVSSTRAIACDAIKRCAPPCVRHHGR